MLPVNVVYTYINYQWVGIDFNSVAHVLCSGCPSPTVSPRTPPHLRPGVITGIPDTPPEEMPCPRPQNTVSMATTEPAAAVTISLRKLYSVSVESCSIRQEGQN